MATAAVDEEEDVLTCSVCFDRYTDPCTLQCKHSFCRRCITDYVKTQADALQAKTIPCPSCRQVTKVPDPSRPVDEWAGQLQPGHVVQELIARVEKDTAGKDPPCFPCQQLGETTSGKFLCAQCEVVYCQRCAKTHSVIPTSRGHVLCDIQDKGKIRQQRKFRCKVHNKALKLYCKDCNKIHCQLCFVDNHRKCEDVVTIKSFISKMKTELSEVGLEYAKQEKESKSIIQKKKDRISQVNIDKTSAVDGIRRTSQKLIDLINEKENQLMEEVEESIKIETKTLRSDIKEWNIQIQTYRQYSEYIKQAVSSDSEVEVCDVYQVWKTGQLDISQEGDTKMGKTVLFSEDAQNINAIDSLHLGDIVTTCLHLDETSSPMIGKSVDMRVDDDEEAPGFCHITVMEVEGVQTVVVTDYNNKCVKSFYTKNKETCRSRLPLSRSPRGITHWRDNYVMVAVPDSRQIITIAVTPVPLRETSIHTSKSYVCLGVLTSSRLAAGSSDCVDILDMQGNVIKSVSTHKDMKLLSEPDFMCVSSTGQILVSDWHRSSVICLTADGNILWETMLCHPDYEEHASLRGITTNGEDIFVAEMECERVIQLSMSGEYYKHILTRDQYCVTCAEYDLADNVYPAGCRFNHDYTRNRDGIRNPSGICVDKHGTLLLCDDGRLLNLSKVSTISEMFSDKPLPFQETPDLSIESEVW